MNFVVFDMRHFIIGPLFFCFVYTTFNLIFVQITEQPIYLIYDWNTKPAKSVLFVFYFTLIELACFTTIALFTKAKNLVYRRFMRKLRAQKSDNISSHSFGSG